MRKPIRKYNNTYRKYDEGAVTVLVSLPSIIVYTFVGVINIICLDYKYKSIDLAANEKCNCLVRKSLMQDIWH